ncbi:MAG: 16S rRNA (uracil(1498)-N(3))-methyltransferase [Eggerthellaceae bacterium]|nr:16S rRNA (uracil(1498)-N(3))-methyltransferase [Eggerthellaceae bacterium]
MSLHRFFLNNQVLAEESDQAFALRLSPADIKHARVLRLKVGEHLAIIDAASDYFECEIVSFDDDLVVRICAREGAAEETAQVILLQGLAKADKFDEVVRHATEIGVAAFVPLICERSVIKLDSKKAAARVERWEAIAKSAAMQAGLRSIPEIAEPVSIDDACAMIAGATCVIVAWEQAQGLNIKTALDTALADTLTPRQDARIAVVVGPEGGLTEAEVSRLCSCNKHAYAVTLGPNILRTETAGLVAPALTLYELGGLQ